ncbi:MAG TPA: guanylate kinase [Gemmatimonadales bacterium]|nr:guanylate kinase [Gemmatimonadales bacterium]
MKPFPLVLSAPSGGGKTTIAKALLAAREDLGYSVSATTRPPRPGEEDGRDYFFLTRQQFEQKIAAGEFVEWAEYGGELYGTLRSQLSAVLGSGRHCVLDIEINGARAVRAMYPDAVLVFVVPPSAEELFERLGGTKGTRATSLAQRLRRAVEELSEALEYDYVVVNAERTEALADVAAILDAEMRRTRRNPDLKQELDKLSRDIASLADRLADTEVKA